MEKISTESMTVERKGIFDKNHKKRFELTFTCKDRKPEKSILIIGLNPASADISILDTTTTFILNNLIPMGYTTMTVCNLYADLFTQRLKPSEVASNTENRKYLEEVLKRGFDAVLLGYGNTFLTNKFVKEEKERLLKLLKPYKEKVVDIVDDKGEYERLKATHPLMAGRYFPNRWKLRPFEFEEKNTLKEAGNGKLPEKAGEDREKKLPGKIKKSEKEKKEKKQDEKDNPNQDSEPVAPAETDKQASGEETDSRGSDSEGLPDSPL